MANFRKVITCHLLAGTAVVLMPALAFAQNVHPANSVSPEDIVVTARKQSEQLSTTPLAVSAMSGADLERSGVKTLDNIGQVAPNVVINHSSTGLDVVMRGIQDNGQGQTQTPGVAVVIDNVTQLDARALITPFFDVDHIEVLRGPQGTLYGAASPGGVIKIVNAQPKFEFGGSADVELANYNTKRGNFVINAPLSDKLAMRLATSFNDRDGYLIQAQQPGLMYGGANGGANLQPGGNAKLNAEHDWSTRGSILYQASADTSLLLSATIQHSYNSPYSSVPYSDFASANSGLSQRLAPANPITPNTNDWFYNVNGAFKTRFGGVAAEVNAGYSYITFNDVGIDNGGIIPPGGPGWLWFPTLGHDNTYSGEARLHNADAAKLEWTVGASYIGVRSLTRTATLGAPCLNPDVGAPGPGGTDGNACLDGVSGPYNPSVAQSQVNSGSQSYVKRNSTGLYGTLQYHLTDTLEATGGARLSFDDIAQDGYVYKFITGGFATFGTPGSTYYSNPCTGLNWNTPLCLGTGGVTSSGYAAAAAYSYADVHNNLSYKATKVTWKVGLDWKPSARDMLYANIATGYKPGGFNAPSGYTQSPCCYSAESLVAYELGYKGRPLPWLRLDSDVFYYDYKAMQVVSQFELGNANFTSATVNTPTRVYGLENTATVTPTRQDSLTFGVNYLHSEFVNLLAGGNSGVAVRSWAGHVLDKSPSWTLSANWRHKFDFGARGDVTFNIGTQYTSEYFLNVISNAQTYRQSPFTKSNADITYTTKNGMLSIQAFVKNIEDRVEETAYNGNPAQLGNGNVAISEPRYYGMRLKYKM